MKALVFDTAGELEEVVKLKEMEKPSISQTQVLVSVKARPVNPSDRFFARGAYRKKPVFPQIAGLEGSGIIVECGSQVTGFVSGDHVAFRALKTWADYCVVDQEALIRIDEDIPFELSCQLGLNALTAFALLDELRLKAGDWLVMTAAGSSLASLIGQLAASSGIRVIALGRDVEGLRQKGYADAFSQNDAALAEKIRAVTQGQGVSGLLDAVGGKVVTTLLACVAPYGSIIAYGNYSNNEPATITNGALIYQNLTLKGFGIDHWTSRQTPERLRTIFAGLVHQVAEGRLQFAAATAIALADFVSGGPDVPKEGKWILV